MSEIKHTPLEEFRRFVDMIEMRASACDGPVTPFLDELNSASAGEKDRFITILAALYKFDLAAIAKAEPIEMSDRAELNPYPREMTDDLRDVLSMMMWNTGPIARVLRAGGADIPTKGELEQAHVLHWLTLLVLEHGPAWRENAQAKVKAICAALGGSNG